jgi:hypothetical protein
MYIVKLFIDTIMANDFDLTAWARITIEHWQRNIDRQHIGRSGALRRSITAAVNNGDSSAEVTFRMNWYGIMPDMGAGRGRKAGSASALVHSKPWLQKQLAYEMAVVRDIAARALGRKVMVTMGKSLAVST